MPTHIQSHLAKILKKHQQLPFLNPAFADYMSQLQKQLGVTDSCFESLGTFPVKRWCLYHFAVEAKKPEKWTGNFTIQNVGCEYVEYQTDCLFRECNDLDDVLGAIKGWELESKQILN